MSEKLSFVNAITKSIRDILDTEEYSVDFYQREYLWQKKHIQHLLEDLTSKFLTNFDEKHERGQVKDYSKYFMGSIILNLKENQKLIIDGQQRLTSLTLLLIYLNNLQKNNKDEDKVLVDNLIFSKKFGKKSFNIQIQDRIDCIRSLYDDISFEAPEKNESVTNLMDRYDDMEELFPPELTKKTLPYFIDWLIEHVMFVVIETYSDEDAYKIFETMNNRGLSLTQTDMLKGYLLSKITTKEDKNELNNFWKKRIAIIKDFDKTADIEFFQAWLRGKYADTIRQAKAGAKDEDFEIIGSKFNSWVNDKEEKMGLKKEKSYYEFIKTNFDFYSKQYLRISDATCDFDEKFKHVYFIAFLGLAPSLYYPLFLAPLNLDDDDKTIDKKIQLVSRYLEAFSVLRKINWHSISHSTIRARMYNLVKQIRNKSVDELVEIFKKSLQRPDEQFDEFLDYMLGKQNKTFVKFLLARITSHIEEKSGISPNFEKYVIRAKKSRHEIEHIWADKFEEHKDEFDNQSEFDDYRNSLGGLILIPRGLNQSYGALPYEKKLVHYFGQNLLAQSLYSKCYEKNPSFLRYIKKSNLPFEPYKKFTKKSIDERQELYKKICEEIWDVKEFGEF